MGFPVGYTEVVMPKVFLHILCMLSYIRTIICSIFRFLHQDISFASPAPLPHFQSVTALLLPVVTFSELAEEEEEEEEEESCAVCLYEFEGEDEIRRLTKCRHIFHRGCLDRWMGYEQRTCPLCRTPFLPDPPFNHTLWPASAIPHFYHHFPSSYS